MELWDTKVDAAAALLERGDVVNAQDLLQGLLDGGIETPALHFYLGVAAHKQRRFADAVGSFDRAAELEPALPGLGKGRARSLLGLARQFEERGEPAHAEVHLRQALEEAPGDGEIRTALINLLKNRCKHEAAVAVAGEAVGIFRVHAALNRLPLIAGSDKEMRQAREEFETAAAALGDIDEDISEDELRLAPPNFMTAYQAAGSRAAHEAIGEFYRRASPELEFAADGMAGYDGAGPIRIGFTSAFLNNHTIGKLNRGLIGNLDRTRFHVCVFTTEPPADEIGRFIAERADEVVVLPGELAAARQVIAGKRLHILHYPEIGMDPFTYFLAFARLAPVQGAGWGHPVTTGLTSVDYFLSVVAGEPDPGAGSHYTERLHRLSQVPGYLYPPQAPGDEPSAIHDLSQVFDTVYLCAQSLFKVLPGFDPLLGALLQRQPKACIVFIEGRPGWSERLAARWRRTIPETADRIRFVGRQDQDGFLRMVRDADVILDTPFYSGGQSTSEALGLGKAVVAWPGTPYLAGNASAAMLRQMGLDELIAADGDDYVDIADRLGSDAAYRGRLEARVDKAASRLFERRDAVREIEAFFEGLLAD